jgi:hypothetical protein
MFSHCCFVFATLLSCLVAGITAKAVLPRSAAGPIVDLGYSQYEGTTLSSGVNQYLGMRSVPRYLLQVKQKTASLPTSGVPHPLLPTPNSPFGYTSRAEDIQQMQTGTIMVQPWLKPRAKILFLSILITGLEYGVS